jgi:hypothetical protein
MLFDINLAGEFDGFVMYHQPVASLRPIKPFSLRLPLATGTQMLVEPAHINCELCILDMCYLECPLICLLHGSQWCLLWTLCLVPWQSSIVFVCQEE